MPHGKKLTIDQRKLLKKKGIVDSTDWLYMGMKVIGDKSPARNSNTSTQELLFKNRVTNEEIRVEI